MRRALVCLLVLATLSPTITAQPPKVGTHSVKLNGHTFTLPIGFEIEVAAPSSIVPRPITADFDEAGNLYVTDSSGTNDPVQVQLEKKPHRVLRLTDTHGDGKFDRATVFADKLMFPEGTMWLDGSLYVSAAPSIWKLTDADGDGVAEKRVEWFQGKTLTGCANDLHGPYAGPDGWIYWCKGAFAKQTYTGPNGQPWSTRAAHIFRCRPDGSGLEPVMTGGMDNPVHVVFLPNGERFFTTTFLQHPANGLRDGMIHAILGGVYGKVHDVLDDHVWTSPEVLPVMTHLGPAAPSGLARYESTSFGQEYRDNLFACQFNLHKVSRHVLIPSGSTYATRDEDFLVSDNIDFHPTSLVEDADGSLLIIDTGGWYKLCCPSSQLHKPDILGAIYRIRRQGAPKVDDARGQRIDWKILDDDALIALMDDPRPAVRRRSIQRLAARGESAVKSLNNLLIARQASSQTRRNAVWTLARIESPASNGAIRQALADGDETVRQAALNVVSLRRDAEAAPMVRNVLSSPAPLDRRLAAECLGRIGGPLAVDRLLMAAARPTDRCLEHAIIFALVSLNSPKDTEVGLKSPDEKVRRIAMIALDQMPGENLKSVVVVRELKSATGSMRETLLWIAGRHANWGPAMANFLREQLAAAETSTPAARNETLRLLARFAAAPAIQSLIATSLGDQSISKSGRIVVLKGVAEAQLKSTPSDWVDRLAELVNADDPEVAIAAIQAAGRLPVKNPPADKLAAALRRVVENAAAPVQLRLSAIAAIPGGLRVLSPAWFDFVRQNLGRDRPVAERAAAVDILARARLSSDQLVALAHSLGSVGPLEFQRLFDTFTQSTDARVGLELVSALKASPMLGDLRGDVVRSTLAKYPPAVQQAGQELLAKIDADFAKQASRLDDLFKNLHDGDIRRGQAVFFGKKAGCINCHALAYQGGRIGPDLTKIGTIRTERDLLESIIFPSASIVRSYEPVRVETTAGKSYNGLIRSQSPDEIELVLGAEQTIHLRRSEIEEIRPSKVSIMPAGLDKVLTVQELADLVAFLKSRK
jgi:putative membrane-bound dehydrogenase-like protein